jgi:hypothetical protein
MAIQVTTNFAPANSQEFWLLASDHIKGGRVEKANLDALNAIPVANRKHGMLGFAQDTEREYIVDITLNWVDKAGSTGDRIGYTVTTSSPHGLSKLDVVGYNNGYVKVTGNSVDDIDAIGVVSEIIDPNNFEITLAGRITLNGGTTYEDNVAEGTITENTTYFLSPITAGRLELSEPTQVGQVKKAILQTLSDGVGIVNIQTGVEIVEDPVDEDDPDLVGYDTIQKDGVPSTNFHIINFTGTGWSVTADAVNNRTNVTFTPTGLGLFSGDVLNSGVGNLVTQIAPNVVSNAKLGVMPTMTFKANPSGVTTNPQDVGIAQARQMLGIAIGTANQLAKFTGANTVGSSQIFDTGSAVSIQYLVGTGTEMVVVNSTGVLSRQPIPTGGGGAGTLTSLNGLTVAVQTFAVPGTTGTTPNWVSSGSVHTLNIPQANAVGVTRGTISKTEFDVFNAKLGGTGTANTLAKFSSTVGLVTNSSISDTGSAVIASVVDFAVFGSNVNYVISRITNSSGSGEIDLYSYGTTGGAAYWSGLATANTNSIYSNRTLVINSANNLILSGSGTAEHVRITTGGDVGLGITPTARLHVNSSSTATVQKITNTNGTAIMQLAEYGSTFVGNHWTGVPAANTGQLYSNRQLIIQSESGLVLSGSSVASHITVDVSGFVNIATLAGSLSRIVMASSTGGISTYSTPTTSALIKFSSTGITNSAITESAGTVTIPNLASGGGNVMVVANASGALSTLPIPSGGATLSGTTNYITKFTSASTVGNSAISETSGTLTIPSLGGSGTRMVVTDNSGNLSQQAIPSFSGITGSGTFGELATFTGSGSIGDSGVVVQSNSVEIYGDRSLLLTAKAFDTNIALLLGGGMYVQGNGVMYLNGGAIPTTQSRGVDWWRVYRDASGFLKV